MFDMRRRAFITLLGGAAVAWPLAARAQQAMPVIGVINSGTSAANAKNVTALRQALKEAGFVDRESVVIEFRWAENQFHRLPGLVSDLIGLPVAVIVGNTLSALRAKAATTRIPIVFTTGSDPVRDGLVTSLSRPGGNVTGVVFITGVLGSKRLDLLRQFVPKAATILGGAAAAWPFAAGAQQGEHMRRIGVLMNKAADDAEGRAQVSAFEGALQQRGWKLGGNLQIDYRWSAGDASRYRSYAAELVAQAPDLLLGVGGTVVGALQRATRDVPIVFVGTTDPVNRGLVASLSRPGGNTTGFTQFEFGISGKWLELLKEIAPSVTRAAVIRDPSQFSGVGMLAAIQAIAPSLRVELSALDARDTGEIERALTNFARQPNGGVIVTASAAADHHRDLIITLAKRHRLPTVHAYRYFVTDGGLIAYGPDTNEPFRLAAGYADRILKGEKPGDLPVQEPTRYQLVINLKTAKALGLDIPATVLARADEVIE